MKAQFVINPHDDAIVDVWLGDVFLGELHGTARGFTLMTPGRISIDKPPRDVAAYEGGGVLPLESLEVSIATPEG